MRLINEEYLQVLYEAIRVYGEQTQIMKAIEEMSELTKALCKGNDHRAIVDETADVIIMLQQIVMMFELGDELEKRIRFKVNRLKERLDYSRIGNHIKGYDLCSRCSINLNCVLNRKACVKCKANTNKLGCYCQNIDDGTPCDLFTEADDDS